MDECIEIYLPVVLVIIGVLFTVFCFIWIFKTPFDMLKNNTNLYDICKTKPSIILRKNDLKQYSDEYLYMMMQVNNKIDVHELAWYSSEILRRMLEKEHKKDSINEGYGDD
jgi:hypothetical protein